MWSSTDGPAIVEKQVQVEVFYLTTPARRRTVAIADFADRVRKDGHTFIRYKGKSYPNPPRQRRDFRGRFTSGWMVFGYVIEGGRYIGLGESMDVESPAFKFFEFAREPRSW